MREIIVTGPRTNPYHSSHHKIHLQYGEGGRIVVYLNGWRLANLTFSAVQMCGGCRGGGGEGRASAVSVAQSAYVTLTSVHAVDAKIPADDKM